MSDETPPPSLRLKPRQRTDAEAPPPAPSAPGGSADSGKLRLKPKLNAETPPAPAAEIPPPSAEPAPAAGPAPERVRLKPKLNAEPAQPPVGAPPEVPAEAAAESEAPAEGEASAEPEGGESAPPPDVSDAPKPKLKIKIPGALSDAPADGAPVDPNVPPPFPVVLAPGAEGVPPPAGGSRPGVPRPGAPVRRLPAEALAKKNRSKKIVKLIMVGVGSVALAVGMLKFAMVKFIDPPPPPPSIIPKPRPPVKIAPIVDVPNPPETEPETKPAQAEAPPTASKPVRPVKTPPKKSGETTTKATSDLAPGVTVTSDAVQAEVEASSEFRTFVADAKVSGVFQGSPARAFINGRLVRAGEVVDSAMGIKFESVDPSTKTIVFKDSSGAKVSKHY